MKDFITYDLEYCKEHFHVDLNEIHFNLSVSIAPFMHENIYLDVDETDKMYTGTRVSTESENILIAQAYGELKETTIPIWSIKEYVSKETHPEYYI